MVLYAKRTMNRVFHVIERTAFYLSVLIALIVIVSFCPKRAQAAGILRDAVSNYAYTKEDYEGIDRAAKSVFYVEIYDSEENCIGSGSGFIMFNENVLITNQHVIEGASFLAIMDDDGKVYVLDRVIASDKEHDIAILYFPDGMNYNPLDYDATFTDLVRGQPVLTIGSPKGMPGTVSDGIISAFPMFSGQDAREIQITAPISHGSSGGCLLNDSLKVIGVTSAGIDEGQNIGFAVPVYIVENLYKQWNKRDTIKLGSPGSWDTVGAGIHEKITGISDKPGGSSSQAASGSDIQAASPTQPPVSDDSAPVIDVDVASGKLFDNDDGYFLTVNNHRLEWLVPLQEVVDLCRNNGLMLEYFDGDKSKDAYYYDDRIRIRFHNELFIDHGFYLRHAANSNDLVQIDMHIEERLRADEFKERAIDIYQRLISSFPLEDERESPFYIKTKDDYHVVEAQNVTELINKIVSNPDVEYIGIFFDNLRLYLKKNYSDPDLFDIQIGLAYF